MLLPLTASVLKFEVSVVIALLAIVVVVVVDDGDGVVTGLKILSFGRSLDLHTLT